MTQGNNARLLNQAAIVLGCLGIFVGLTLTLSHFRNLIPPCGGTAGCSIVLTSQWSKIGPVPTSALGLAAYIAITLLAMMRTTQAGKVYRQNVLISFVLTIGGVLASAFYTYLSLGVIRSACYWCLGSAALMVLLFVVHALLQNTEAPEEAEGFPLPVVGAGALAAVALTIFSMSALEEELDRGVQGMVVSGATREQMLGTDPDKIVGNKNAKVILIEFADPNCIGCRRTHPNVKALVNSFGDKIAFKFKAFPLPIPGHETSIAACMAMEWAAEKGQYKKVYDAIWNEGNTERIKTEDGIIAILNESGLKGGEFRDILFSDKPEHKKLNEGLIAKVQADYDLGKSFRVGGTPSFVILADGVAPKAASSARLEGILRSQPYADLLRQ